MTNSLHTAAAQFMARQQQAPVPITAPEVDEAPFSNAIEGLLAKIREASDAFEAELAALPNQKPCTRHQGQTAVLLVDKSWDAKKAVYGCPDCADDARTRRRSLRMDAAGIPRDVRHANLANFDLARPGVKQGFNTPAQFIDAARKFLAGDSRNALFCGTPGIGKGHIAAAIAIQIIDAGKDAAWIDCAGLFSAYHEAYSSGTTAQVRDRYALPHLLILDEICLRDLPADGEEILFSILDMRHKAERQTLLLSNKPGPKIKDWIGGRIYDRLKSGGCLYRYGEWESMRGTSKDGSEVEF